MYWKNLKRHDAFVTSDRYRILLHYRSGPQMTANAINRITLSAGTMRQYLQDLLDSRNKQCSVRPGSGVNGSEKACRAKPEEKNLKSLQYMTSGLPHRTPPTPGIFSIQVTPGVRPFDPSRVRAGVRGPSEHWEQATTTRRHTRETGLAQQMELEDRVRKLQVIDAEKLGVHGGHGHHARHCALALRALARVLRGDGARTKRCSSSSCSSGASSPRVRSHSRARPAPATVRTPRARVLRWHTTAMDWVFEKLEMLTTAKDDKTIAWTLVLIFASILVLITTSCCSCTRKPTRRICLEDATKQFRKGEKDDLEDGVKDLQTALQTQEQSAAFLHGPQTNSRISTGTSKSPFKRCALSFLTPSLWHRFLSGSHEFNDSYKNEVERLRSSKEETKIKHETDVTRHHKHATALARQIRRPTIGSKHISALKGTLDCERELCMEYRRKILEAGFTERLDEEEDGEDEEKERRGMVRARQYAVICGLAAMDKSGKRCLE
ncbi:hypothetical protein DFH11DRAFT_1547359 [Phellopilus nigrolimitatus]|nr:hypothetical protein DFH11DRAFT_1547359 [Phellopilus nigrolimitatus]